MCPTSYLRIAEYFYIFFSSHRQDSMMYSVLEINCTIAYKNRQKARLRALKMKCTAMGARRVPVRT